MGAQQFKPRFGATAFAISAGTIEGLQVPLERVLVNVGMLLNDARGFPPHAMERLDTIHRETAQLYETVARLAHGEPVGEVELL